MAWLSRQFSTRVIVLIPIAIAINIVLGYTVQTILKLPIYLDSIGTILVGVLAGPIAGALTGILSNLIWQYAPVIGGGTIGPFAITAGVIGLLAGVWGQLAVYRSRPASGTQLIAGGHRGGRDRGPRGHPDPQQPRLHGPERRRIPELGVHRGSRHRGRSSRSSSAGFIYIRRDLAGLWVAVAGVLTGIVAAFVSAPISAIAFGGVTGGGTDLLVAALRQGGSDVIHASLGQGLFSDPIDKTITSFVVFIILSGLSPRLLARFPLGERLTRNRAA